MLWYTHYLPFLGNFHPGIYPSMVLLLYVTGCWDLERVTQSSGSVLFFFSFNSVIFRQIHVLPQEQEARDVADAVLPNTCHIVSMHIHFYSEKILYAIIYQRQDRCFRLLEASAFTRICFHYDCSVLASYLQQALHFWHTSRWLGTAYLDGFHNMLSFGSSFFENNFNFYVNYHQVYMILKARQEASCFVLGQCRFSFPLEYTGHLLLADNVGLVIQLVNIKCTEKCVAQDCSFSFFPCTRY